MAMPADPSHTALTAEAWQRVLAWMSALTDLVARHGVTVWSASVRAAIRGLLLPAEATLRRLIFLMACQIARPASPAPPARKRHSPPTVPASHAPPEPSSPGFRLGESQPGAGRAAPSAPPPGLRAAPEASALTFRLLSRIVTLVEASRSPDVLAQRLARRLKVLPAPTSGVTRPLPPPTRDLLTRLDTAARAALPEAVNSS